MEYGRAAAPPRNRLPSPKALGVAGLVVLALVGLWLPGRIRRNHVEGRAAAVASTIAGRPVGVRCPGPFRRHLMYETTEGSVRFGADGVPFDSTSLSAHTCDGLRAAALLGPGLDLDCLAYGCPAQRTRIAAALAVLAHESVHLRGVLDEGATECGSHRYIGLVARAYGLSDRAGGALARWQATDWMDTLPERYRAC